MAAMQPLADHYTALGLRVRIVNVQDVYDEFSGGIFDPQAIHDFLAYAYANWVWLVPMYVLLVGDGNYDFRNYQGTNEPEYIPPYLANVDPWIGETAANNRYVTVSGADILPHMALGLLPVRTATEASQVVSKLLGYDAASAADWQKQAVFVADNPDSGGDFPASADLAASLLPSSFSVDKIYLPTGASSAVVQADRTAYHQRHQCRAADRQLHRPCFPNLLGHREPVQHDDGQPSLANAGRLPVCHLDDLPGGVLYCPLAIRLGPVLVGGSAAADGWRGSRWRLVANRGRGKHRT